MICKPHPRSPRDAIVCALEKSSPCSGRIQASTVRAWSVTAFIKRASYATTPYESLVPVKYTEVSPATLFSKRPGGIGGGGGGASGGGGAGDGDGGGGAIVGEPRNVTSACMFMSQSVGNESLDTIFPLCPGVWKYSYATYPVAWSNFQYAIRDPAFGCQCA